MYRRVIKRVGGEDRKYVLVPVNVYNTLKSAAGVAKNRKEFIAKQAKHIVNLKAKEQYYKRYVKGRINKVDILLERIQKSI